MTSSIVTTGIKDNRKRSVAPTDDPMHESGISIIIGDEDGFADLLPQHYRCHH